MDKTSLDKVKHYIGRYRITKKLLLLFREELRKVAVFRSDDYFIRVNSVFMPWA